jgi:hypothetical protein
MAQGVDGNWYGYFGDKTQVPLADESSYLNFGTDSDPTIYKGDWAEASNVYKNQAGSPQNVATNYPTLSSWNGTGTVNMVANAGVGQIGIAQADWPVIQLYDFTIGMFDVVLEQAGADEVVTLDFNSADLDDYASLTLDRSSASQESEIHLVITDNQLNIDPTAEDIVSFWVGGSSLTNGVSWMNRTTTWGDTDYIAYSNAFDDNGKLIINNATNGGASILANDATLDASLYLTIK